jgi:uncharacterized membrane protein YjgN (DUF898 family)
MTTPADPEGVAPLVADPAAAEVEPPPPSAAVSPPEPSLHPVWFSGTGAEYFRIWIVNLVLMILTLGVYSAWAKVRRLQYFYRHTRLAGSGFDYHGDPIAILKGRLVGLVLLGLYAAISYVQFWVAVAILATLALIMPFLVSRSLKFRLHNSSYRGIRFRFSGSVRSAYWIFLGLPMLMVLSLFLLGPFWHHRVKRYQWANAAYGRTPFSYRAAVGEFYATYGIAVAAMAIVMVVLVFGTIAIGVVLAFVNGPGPATPDTDPAIPTGFAIVFLIGYVLAVLAVQAITVSRIQNTVWNTMRLGPHGFRCQIGWFTLFRITLTNLVATVLTLGLYRPFAQVRLTRYLASCLVMVPSGPLDDLLAAESEDVSAIGEESVGFFDLDVGF